jgi:hypothetical protein
MYKTIPVVLCCVVVIIAFVLYNYTRAEKFVTVGTSSITLYHSPQCSHCVAFMPIWDQFASKATIIAKKIDCTKESCPNIDGFPTVLLRKSNGTTVQFEQKRTVDNLVAFVNGNK